MIDRNSLYHKIQALLAKTTERGCTEAEMLAALAKAKAMMDAHQVTEEELQLSKTESAVLREEPSDSRDPHQMKWYMANAVAEFCDCEIFKSPAGFRFCGLASDADWAVWLLDHLVDFVCAELVSHLMFSLAPRDERKKVMKGFVIGCTGRISDRLLELCRSSAAQRTSNGSALMAIKSQAIAKLMDELGIKVRTSRAGYSRSFNEAALEAGRQAGDRASFGRSVSGEAGVLRLRNDAS